MDSFYVINLKLRVTMTSCKIKLLLVAFRTVGVVNRQAMGYTVVDWRFSFGQGKDRDI